MSDNAIELTAGGIRSAVAMQEPVTLVLLFKRPLVGQGKQRLAASFGLEPTLRVAEQLLRCALEDLAAWQGPVVLAPADSQDCHWAEQLLGRAEVVAQGPGNLGERIVDLDLQLRSRGHRQLAYIGSDAPALTPGHYRSVSQRLIEADVVLSAAEDGGVTIMASTSPWPAALLDLPWSSDRLGRTLAECCRQQGSEVCYLEPSYDVDLEQDLARLTDDLARDERPQRQALLKLLRRLRGSE